MHRYTDYGWLRGFNVVPSWAARIEQAWWEYDGRRFREEVALARGVHANCIRIWIEFTAWMADPETVRARFLDAVAGIAEQGMKTMHCNECIPGCLDDLRRAECARWSIAALEEAGYGWIGWGMREGKTVSTRRDRYDGNGLDDQGFHAWFHADGSLRDGLDFLREPPRRRAPWEEDTAQHDEP